MAKASEIEKKGSSSPQAATNKCVVGVAVDCEQNEVKWSEGGGVWENYLTLCLVRASTALSQEEIDASDRGILVARLLGPSSKGLDSLGIPEDILSPIGQISKSLSVESHFIRSVSDHPSFQLAVDRISSGRFESFLQEEVYFSPTVTARTLKRNPSPALRDVGAISCMLWTPPSKIDTASPCIESLVKSHLDAESHGDYCWQSDLPNKSDQLLVNALSAAAEYLFQDWVVARKDAGMDLPPIGAFLLQVSDDRLHGAFVVQERDNLRLQAASGSMRREAQAHLDSDVSFANYIVAKVIASLRGKSRTKPKSDWTARWQLKWPADKVAGSASMEMADVKFLALPSEGSDFTASTTELSWFLRSTPEVCHTDILGTYLRSMLPFPARPDGLGEISRNYDEVDLSSEESESLSTTEPFLDLSSESFADSCEQFVSWLELEKTGLPADLTLRAIKYLEEEGLVVLARKIRNLVEKKQRQKKQKKPEAVAIGKRIKKARARLGITLAQLEKATGIEKGNLSHYESGDKKAVRDTLRKLSKPLGVTTEWLTTGKKSKKSS